MFLYSKWMQLDLPTRMRIAGELGIEKKNPSHVADNKVVNDGYLIQDIEAVLTVEKLQHVLNTDETDLHKLWDMIVHSTPVRPEDMPNGISVLPVQEPTDETKEQK